MKIAIIGAGNVGSALASGWARTDHEVTLALREPSGEKAQEAARATGVSVATVAEAVAGAEIVVLAVPWGAAEAAIRAAGDLAGKVLIDCTNPLGADLGLSVGHTTSGAELVAGWAPAARVVKCFNSVGANIMAEPRFGEACAMMCLAGDDAAARDLVATLATDLGFEPLDCGPLSKARLIEPLAALWISLAVQGRNRELAFGLLRR